MVRSETDRAQPVCTGTQNHPTQDHIFFEHAGREGACAAEGVTIGVTTSTPPPISTSEALAAQHHLAIIQPVANVLLIDVELRMAHAHLRGCTTQEEMADAQRRIDVILTRLARAATEAVATPQHDGERGSELRSTARGPSPSSFFTPTQNFAARDFTSRCDRDARDAHDARFECDARGEHYAGGDSRDEFRDAARMRHAYARARSTRGERDSHGAHTAPHALPRGTYARGAPHTLRRA
jgi:hypothetical protein